MCCAGLLAYLQAAMREHALRVFRRELAICFPREQASAAAPWELSWERAREAMPTEHAVPGGLSEEERRALFEAHVESLRAQLGDEAERGGGEQGGGASPPTKAPPVRVDVSDLGLTMDDLSGPMGDLS